MRNLEIVSIHVLPIPKVHLASSSPISVRVAQRAEMCSASLADVEVSILKGTELCCNTASEVSGLTDDVRTTTIENARCV